MRAESYCWRCAKRGVLFTNSLPGILTRTRFPGEAVAGHLLFVGIQLSFGLGTMSQLQASCKPVASAGRWSLAAPGRMLPSMTSPGASRHCMSAVWISHAITVAGAVRQ